MSDSFVFSTFSKSFAKLNLSLHVGEYDPNARMHVLQSQMVLVDFYETLLFKIVLFPYSTDYFDFQIRPAEQCCPVAEDNIMFKAACEWHKMRKIGLSVRVWHDDNVPTRRGFGIASSNAAELVKTLERCSYGLASSDSTLATTSISISEVKKLCASLGSDVSFFYEGNANSLVGGVGEKITPLKSDDEPKRFIIAIPPFHSVSSNAFKCLYENGKKTYDDFEHLEMNMKAKKILCEITGSLNWKTTGSGTAQFIENPSPSLLSRIRKIRNARICGFRFVEASRLLDASKT